MIDWLLAVIVFLCLSNAAMCWVVVLILKHEAIKEGVPIPPWFKTKGNECSSSK